MTEESSTEVASKELFTSWDVDHSGTLTIEEIRTALHDFKFPEEDAERIMHKMDRQGKGYITYQDFKAYVDHKESRIQRLFNALDSNHDHSIQREEVRDVLKELAMEDSEATVDSLFSLVDKDHDGAISYPEFREFVLLMPSLSVQALFERWMTSSSLIDEPGANALQDKSLSPTHLLLCGGIAGVISRSVTAPLDRLKTMFQAGPPPGQPQYTSIMGACRHVMLEKEGWRGFFKGNGTNVLKIAPETAVKFWSYERLKTMIPQDPEHPTVPERLMSGSLSGVVSQSLIYPLEITKTRLAISTAGECTGIGNTLISILRNEGPRALYKGLTPSLCGIVPYAGVDLTIFSMLKEKYMAKYDTSPGTIGLLACGATSSTCGQVVAYPLVVVRTRLQAQGMKGRPVLYSGMLDCFGKLVRTEGITSLYRGLLPNFMKSIPAISISYVIYEKTKQFFLQKK